MWGVRMVDYRPLNRLAGILQTLLGCLALAAGYALATVPVYVTTVDGWLDGSPVADVTGGLPADADLGRLIVLGTAIAAAVTWVAWFGRIHTNLGALGRLLEHARWQAIWTWFLPIIGWILPRRILDEFWLRSEAGVTTTGPPWTTWTITVWWVLFLAATWGQLAVQLGGGGDVGSGPLAAVETILVACALLCAVLAIVVVRSLTRRVEHLEQVTENASPRADTSS